MEHIHGIREANRVHRAKRVAPLIGQHLKDTRAEALQRFRRDVLRADLREVERLANLVLHSRRKLAKHVERVAHPDDRLWHGRHWVHLMPYLACARSACLKPAARWNRKMALRRVLRTKSLKFEGEEGTRATSPSSRTARHGGRTAIPAENQRIRDHEVRWVQYLRTCRRAWIAEFAAGEARRDRPRP